MAHDERKTSDRRAFLQAGALAAAARLAPQTSAQEAPADARARSPEIPRRPLGKTGVAITMLDQGAVRGASHERILRFSFASGVRVFDSAKAYGSDGNFKKWFEQEGDVRKQIFLVSKDEPKVASQIPAMVDERLAVLGTDWIDLFFIHGLGDHHSLNDATNLVRSKELGQTVAALKKAGKIKFFGFSSHHRDRAAIVQAAAEGGIVDAIMLQYAPWLDKDAPLNKALDACWKRGVGLISMKQIAGRFFGDPPKGNILDDVVHRVPMLAERKLTPFQGLLHAIWTDERISSSCVSMRNTDQIRENTDAARRFEPVKSSAIQELRDAVLAHGPMLCADCDGRCSAAAGTGAELGNLTRFLTYHQHLGDRSEARRQYARLSPEARNWSGADLEAARAACPSRLDFARLLPEVERHLA
jgi:predicted aldo/keto reductase-like oxidoreductase